MSNVSTRPIQSRLDESRIAKLKQLASKKGITISLLIRLILIEYLEGNNG